jgi:hypothetical protein
MCDSPEEHISACTEQLLATFFSKHVCNPDSLKFSVAESNLQRPLNKTNNDKKIIIYKKYILKLLLNVVTAGSEALVISGNKFLYACVREVCHL